MSLRHHARVALVAISVIAASGILAACGSNDQQTGTHGRAKTLQKVTLRLDYTPAGHHVPFYYGKAAGIYADEGIDLNILPGQGSAATGQSVGAGRDQFGWISLSLVPLAVQQHAPIKAVAGIIRRGGFGLLVDADGDIKTWQDLEGKSAIVASSGTQYPLLKAVLQKEHVSGVKIENAGTNAEAIYAGGQGDAVGTLTWYAAPFTNPKRPSRAMDFWDAGIKVLDYGIVAQDDLVKDDPDLVARFVRATVKSWEQAKAQFQGALDHMDTAATEGKPVGYMAPQDWDDQLAVEQKYMDCSVCTDSTQFYTNEFIDEH